MFHEYVPCSSLHRHRDKFAAGNPASRKVWWAGTPEDAEITPEKWYNAVRTHTPFPHVIDSPACKGDDINCLIHNLSHKPNCRISNLLCFLPVPLKRLNTIGSFISTREVWAFMLMTHFSFLDDWSREPLWSKLRICIAKRNRNHNASKGNLQMHEMKVSQGHALATRSVFVLDFQFVADISHSRQTTIWHSSHSKLQPEQTHFCCHP